MSAPPEKIDLQSAGWIFTIAVLGPVIGIILLAKFVFTTAETSISADDPAFKEKATLERIKPAGELKMHDPKEPAPVVVAAAPAKPAGPVDGKAVYSSSCAACHSAGVAGAPKTGDKTAWGPRIGAGKDTLYDHAVKGFNGKAGAMPAKGGNAALSDEEVKAAVDYLISQAK